MHMADALLSPVVGGTMWVATAATMGYCCKKLSQEEKGYKLKNPESMDLQKKIPLMGVLGAFVFASQMINFTIPGTGSSGHIGGGILLASLLGPEAGFLTIASVLLIQCLFFADGGILALGCNMINMGLFACFIGFPFIYSKILKKGFTPTKIMVASILAVVISLQLGALGVVIETTLSGVSELPFSTFVMLMQPIHLAIGAIEGVMTGLVLVFIYNAKPELLIGYNGDKHVEGKASIKSIVITLAVVTVLIGGGLSLYASSNPDGLEWAIQNVTGSDELERTNSVNETLGGVQEKVAFLPDYAFKSDGENTMGTTVSGVVGSAITLGLCGVIAFGLSKAKKKETNE